jgi:DNA repair protein RecO (recombination protein O)
MEWNDEGLVIGLKRLGESASVLEAMTRGHGRHLGLVRGARSSRLAAALQPGNSLGLVWRARLDEHLGAFAVEPLTLRAGRFLPSATALAGLNLIGALLRLLPERDPHESLFEALLALVETLDAAGAPTALARFEARMLEECGFALDLSECAATGTREDLIYVSPKSGRAVSAGAGAPYRERLLPLPAFLREAGGEPSGEDIADAFRLTGHFLERELFGPRGLKLPEARATIVNAALRARGAGTSW